MNNTIKYLGTFAVGFGAGAFFTHQYLNNKLDERLNEEFEYLKNLYEDKVSPTAKEAFDKAVEGINKATEDIKTFRSTIKKQGYNTYFNDKFEVEDDIFENEEEVEEPPEERRDFKEEPYAITADQFADENGLEKTTLTYYVNADILAEDNDVLDEIDSVVGPDFREMFDNSVEEDVVYIRNEKLGMDYEFVRDWSHEEIVPTILGFDGLE